MSRAEKPFLFYGDALDIRRRGTPNESVDLVVLNSPSNSDQGYSAPFLQHNGSRAASRALWGRLSASCRTGIWALPDEFFSFRKADLL